MDRYEVTTIKAGLALVGASLSYLIGGWKELLTVLAALVIIDYLTGMIAGAVEGKLSSEIGYKGAAKKVAIFMLVVVGHLADILMGDGSFIQDAVILFYAGNEALSIIENAGRIGIPVPGKLKKAVALLKARGESEDLKEEKQSA
ncbi:phage holin family protein [Heliobacterium chlorum]|uniref:Phage holin family protein n=1 Tax=Heliobacterium chlorum TaxID=2698 RepID=A0ABR7SYE3_HELCL|nr:phage holin family protein [Heliobacterium chlorum]